MSLKRRQTITRCPWGRPGVEPDSGPQQSDGGALRRQKMGVWYDSRLTGKLRDEAPSAYKDIRAVLRAQKELVKVLRTLRPVLNYKGV